MYCVVRWRWFCVIDLLHKSRNASVPYPTMQHFVTEMFQCGHIYAIRTHHDWPSQMDEHVLISRVKTRALASVSTPLIKSLSAFVRAMRDGCVLYDYHQNIEKILILIDRIFHFRRCQVILWQNQMEPFDCAWFGCCPSGRIPSDDYGIPTCNWRAKWRQAQRWTLGLPKQTEWAWIPPFSFIGHCEIKMKY